VGLTDTAVCPRYHKDLEVIGKRWTGAILRALLLDVSRFVGLRAVPGLSDRLLTGKRLRGDALGVRSVAWLGAGAARPAEGASGAGHVAAARIRGPPGVTTPAHGAVFVPVSDELVGGVAATNRPNPTTTAAQITATLRTCFTDTADLDNQASPSGPNWRRVCR
jgi:hypothetical protein